MRPYRSNSRANSRSVVSYDRRATNRVLYGSPAAWVFSWGRYVSNIRWRVSARSFARSSRRTSVCVTIASVSSAASVGCWLISCLARSRNAAMPSKGRILRCSTCFAVRGAGRALGSLSPGNGRRYSGGGRGAKRRRSWGGNKCVIVMRARVASGATKLKRLQDHALKHTRSRKIEKDQLCRSKTRSQRHSVCFQRLP